ncbi:hypothetical protein, partial [Acidiphilium sp.]|uniref:hypothetical protein n=1 Tax=Acidiphilium sp. TaxID=527 RepID=UPI003D0868AF
TMMPACMNRASVPRVLPCSWAQGKQGKGKQFFFAKKNQKTLMNRGLGFVAVGDERPRFALAG